MDDSGGNQPYQRVDSLAWHPPEREHGKIIKIKGNHIGCAFLVRVRLKHLAAQTGRTAYQLKQGLLDDYLIQQLKNSSLKMALA